MLPLNGSDSDPHRWAVVLAELEEAAEDNQYMQYTYVAALTVLVFEYIFTIDCEVYYAWGRKLTWARTMFFLNRYFFLLQTIAGVASAFLSPTFFSCIFLTRLMETTTVILYVVWAIFSGLRVFAISRFNKAVASLVGLLALVPVVTNITFDAYTQVRILPAPGAVTICFPLQHLGFDDILSLEVLTRISLILSEATVILVIAVQAWIAYRKQRRLLSLTSLILREELLYFLARLLLDVLYLATAILPSQDAPLLVRLFFDAVPPILISRFYFNLDDWDRATEGS